MAKTKALISFAVTFMHKGGQINFFIFFFLGGRGIGMGGGGGGDQGGCELRSEAFVKI